MQQPPPPIMVHVVEKPIEGTTVADVLLGAIGLTGVVVLAAIVLGLALGGVIVLYKRHAERRRTDGPRAGADSDAIHISPYAS
jgi:hypothetical protein